MSSPIVVDPALLDPAAIPAETLAVNAEIIRRLDAEPDGLTIQEVRARRLQGIGAFPLAPRIAERAETMQIDGPGGQDQPARHRAEVAAQDLFISMAAAGRSARPS